jgi:hypothetical protein
MLALAVVLVGCGGTAEPSAGGARPMRDAAPRDGGGRDAGPRDAGARDAGVPDVPLRVAVVSDLNGAYGSTSYDSTVERAIDRVVAWDPDLVLSTGDMVAGQRAGLDYRAMWAAFHAAVSDRFLTEGIPFAVTPGNHDASGYPAFAAERAVFVEEWSPLRRPDLEFVDDADFPLRYAFVAGPALFVSLDSTTVGPLGSEQTSWLEKILEHDAPIKIVYGHVPLYPFAVGRETETIGDPALEALLVDREVDLFVSGHHHAYYPGRRGPLRLVSTACLGAGPRPLLGEDEPRGRSVLYLEITSAGITELDAFGGEAYDTVVDRASLPPSVGAAETEISRDDL